MKALPKGLPADGNDSMETGGPGPGTPSVVSGGFTPTPFWSDRDVPFVAVIGLHRSGSSCLADVLHHLGVHMGDELTGYEPAGGFEAIGLAALCEAAYPFPDTEPALPHDEVVARLRQHVAHVCASAARQGKQMAGGKYPQLCGMGAALREACGDRLRVIHIDRALDESIASLRDRSRCATGWLRADDAQVDRVQRWLWEAKQDLLLQVPHLTVAFADLLADPRREIERIVAWLELAPSEDAVARAVAHVQPERPAHSRTRA
jgi:hypothetical protein